MSPLHGIQATHIPPVEAQDQIPGLPFLLPRTACNSRIPLPLPLPLSFDNPQGKPISRARKPNRHASFEETHILESTELRGSTWSNHGGFRDGDPQPKWMPSKSRIMGKMMMMMSSNLPASTGPRRAILQHQDAGLVRVCSDCSTTKTPLWRSGPQGPKSLCNACGIRQRKARRTTAGREKTTDVDRAMPFKKRCRFVGTEQKNDKACFDDIVRSSKGSAALRRVFPQEEADAAILLMALSCGLVCS